MPNHSRLKKISLCFTEILCGRVHTGHTFKFFMHEFLIMQGRELDGTIEVENKSALIEEEPKIEELGIKECVFWVSPKL